MKSKDSIKIPSKSSLNKSKQDEELIKFLQNTDHNTFSNKSNRSKNLNKMSRSRLEENNSTIEKKINSSNISKE